MNKIDDKTEIPIDNLTVYIRFFFSVFALGFFSIMATGKLLTQIPVFKMDQLKGTQIIRLNIWIVKFQATGDEAVIGFSAFITVLVLIGLTIGQSVQGLINGNLGVNLTQFESICILSAFMGVIISFLLKVLHSTFRSQAINYNSKYSDAIDNLSKK